MKATKSSETEGMLHAWRTRTIHILLPVLAVAAVPVWLISLITYFRSPGFWASTILFSVVLLILVGLAVFRSLDSRVRAWGVPLVGYVLVTDLLALVGPNSSAPLYALGLPVLALVLIGVRAGILCAALSTLEMIVFITLIDRGVIVPLHNPSSALGSISSFLMVLSVMMALLVLFNRFQVKTLEDQRRTAEELEKAHELLEEQNRRLEERVAQRTAELQDSHQRLADIIDFLPDAVLVIDQNSRVTAWNHALEEMTGIPATQMLGKGDRGSYEYALPFYGERRPILIDLVTLPMEELEKRYTSIRREGDVLAGETYVPQLRGKETYLLATAAALRDSQGNVCGAIEVIRDFTERKRMEEDLHKAKEAAEAATQAKSAFLATMSHEIRTPMNAVIGMSGLLLDTQLTADQREFAETIRNSGDALLTIINDILDFSKIEAGRMELENQPFDLRECVESALDLTKVRAAEKGVELACEIGREVPPAIVGDVTRLRQVLVNLLSNAVKFTEQGEVVVSVQAAVNREPASNDIETDTGRNRPCTVHFTVRDTGIGIPPDRLNRLFQAFSQGDSSTTRKYGGTGLGLAVSRRLSEIMGGTMWVESEGVPGKGSTFHFTIQVMEAEKSQVKDLLEGETPELRGRSVLVVDDNATNRRILTLQVQGWGMQAHATGSPCEALEWIRRGEPFDLVILDLQMPEMDGVELAEKIRSGKGQLPLILLSSLGSIGRQIPANLFAACLNKPIRASALFDSLMGIFMGKQAPVPASLPGEPDAGLAQRLPLHILLADDYAVNQKVALRQLARFGYRADVAANGLEAIQALERQPYDVILMDVQMPEMDGLEATRLICSRWPKSERPRIIAMTANAMQGDREMCLAAGMDDYISKPIRVEELVQALARCRPLSLSQATASKQMESEE